MVGTNHSGDRSEQAGAGDDQGEWFENRAVLAQDATGPDPVGRGAQRADRPAEIPAIRAAVNAMAIAATR